MARLNEEGQWIVLLALIISVSIFFLALIVNESVIVGQTTAESVLDLPKSDIQDLRGEVMRISDDSSWSSDTQKDITTLSMERKSSLVSISAPNGGPPVSGQNIAIHYNDGVTVYDETVYY